MAKPSNEQSSYRQAFQRCPKIGQLHSQISSNFLPSKHSHVFEKNMHAVLRTSTSSLLNGVKEKTTQDISRYASKEWRSQNSVSSRGIGYEKFRGREYGSSWGGTLTPKISPLLTPLLRSVSTNTTDSCLCTCTCKSSEKQCCLNARGTHHVRVQGGTLQLQTRLERQGVFFEHSASGNRSLLSAVLRQRVTERPPCHSCPAGGYFDSRVYRHTS